MRKCIKILYSFLRYIGEAKNVVDVLSYIWTHLLKSGFVMGFATSLISGISINLDIATLLLIGISSSIIFVLSFIALHKLFDVIKHFDPIWLLEGYIDILTESICTFCTLIEIDYIRNDAEHRKLQDAKDKFNKSREDLTSFGNRCHIHKYEFELEHSPLLGNRNTIINTIGDAQEWIVDWKLYYHGQKEPEETKIELINKIRKEANKQQKIYIETNKNKIDRYFYEATKS